MPGKPLKLVLASLAFLTECFAGKLPPPPPAGVSAEITAEATRQNNDPVGRPLPLAGHWNATGGTGKFAGFGPGYQLNKITNGNYFLPWFYMPIGAYGTASSLVFHYYQDMIQWCAANGLPISFEGGNWEDLLYLNTSFSSLPADQNPSVINLDGTIRRQLDPLGPVAAWHQAGRLLASSDSLKQLQAWYPNPPLVLFVSNNEAAKLRWSDEETSKRYVDLYGTGTDVNLQMQVTAYGWAQRYAAFLQGFKEVLTPGWQAKAKFTGFGNAGPTTFGSWWMWPWYGLAVPFDHHIDGSAYMWDGGSPGHYLQPWNFSRDDQVVGPQGEAENQLFMKREALTINPQFWWEFSTWDGEQPKRDQLSNIIPFTPDRYGAMIQCLMWLQFPRVVREFRNGSATVTQDGIWFDPTIAAVNRVHSDPVLRKFWRTGVLLPNRAWLHPYQSNLWWYSTEDRWYFLDTTVDGPHPAGMWQPLPVISLALQVGSSPNREWLVYAHAPRGSVSNVGITIPGYQQVFVDVPVGGAFYWVREGQPGAQRVGTA